MSAEWVHLQKMADEMCFYRGAQVESVNHPTACFHVNTGNRFGGDPAIGSWVTHGLGTENDNLPGFVVMAAADEAELVRMVATAASHDEGPIAFRFPRGEWVGVEMPENPELLEIGKGRMIREGKQVAILSFGTRLQEVTKACEALQAKGINPTIADARFAKPLDRDLILKLAETHDALITVEEGAIGDFGSHVAQLLADEGVFDHGLKYRSMVLPDIFIDQASPKTMYDVAGMNAEHIEAKALDVMGVATLEKRA